MQLNWRSVGNEGYKVSADGVLLNSPMSKQFTLTAVKALGDGVLALAYADGEQLELDVKPIIQQHPRLRELATPPCSSGPRWANGGAV